MRLVVVGGTGVVGRYVVEAARRAGHDPVVVARSQGVDVVTGQGLEAALSGASAVIDVVNLRAPDAASTSALFKQAATRLLAAEVQAGVKHHVLLSIVGIDRIAGNPHYAGKRAQEEVVSSGPIPFTILRATQFHEFAGQMVSWTRKDDVAVLPPLLVQPVAAADVADVLVDIATGAPQGGIQELGGPEPQDLIDMARRTLAVRGSSIRLVPSWRGSTLGMQAAGEVLLPGPDARRATTTFDEWLAGEAAARSGAHDA